MEVGSEIKKICVWENFEQKKEPEYIPWESVKEIPEEFWDGWVLFGRDGVASRIIAVRIYDEFPVFLFNGRRRSLRELYTEFEWSPTISGEYKPCGKLKV